MSFGKEVYKTGGVAVKTTSNFVGYNGSPNMAGGVPLSKRRDRIIPASEALSWCDAYFEFHGKNPTVNGYVRNSRVFTLDENKNRVYDDWMTWGIFNAALIDGRYGFEGGSTLRKFLEENNRVVESHNSWRNFSIVGKKASAPGCLQPG